MRANVIYQGDCLNVLRGEIPDASVDLAYLDPPFPPLPSGQLTRLVGEEDPFAGTLTEESPDIPQELASVIDRVAVDAQLRAYLRWLAPRVIQIRRVLKESGSVFVHTRPNGGFHVWLLVDLIFGSTQFRNEIVWRYSAPRLQKKDRKSFIEVHDAIFFYAKSPQNKFHPLAVPPSQDQLRYYANPDKDPRGPYRGVLIHEPTPERLKRLQAEDRLIEPTRPGAAFREKRFLSEVGERAVSNVWTDIPSKQRAAGGRDFYPLQKPEALMERILQAASDPGDVVLDPFCGSGTTLVSAHRLQRRWVGIDASFLAVSFAKNRLQELFGSASPVEIMGGPSTLEAAGELARREPREFERWILSLLGARPLVGDPGIDGRLIFYDEPSGRPKEVIVQVKTRAVEADDVHELQEALDLRGGAIGVVVGTEEAEKSAVQAAQQAGSYVSPVLRTPYPRLQVLTLGDVLEGRNVNHPGADALRDEQARLVESIDDELSN